MLRPREEDGHSRFIAFEIGRLRVAVFFGETEREKERRLRISVYDVISR